MRPARISAIALLLAVGAAAQTGVVPSALGDGGGARQAAARQVAPDGENPCTGPAAASFRCPDLMMRRPFGLAVERSASGRVLLRAGNSIDNVGAGPASLRGTRTSRRFMAAAQLLRRRNGTIARQATRGRLEYKKGHAGKTYWKFHDAARFELWALDAAGTKTAVVRTGPKVAYCLRDLSRTRPSLTGSPRREVYPPCSTNADRRAVTLGTSVGWSDIYPPS